MGKIFSKFKKSKSSLPILAVVFILLAIPITVYTVVKSGENFKNPKAATPSVPGFVEQNVVGTLTKAVTMEFSPDGRLFVAEQCGNLRVVKNGTLLSQPYLTVGSIDCSGERGLLGIAFDPNWATNHYVYVYHTFNNPIHNRVSRFTQSSSNPDIADSASQTTILDLDALSSATNHNGGAMHFGKDGKLYIAVGENANKPNAQSLANRLGKLLRINSDGTIPADNPTSFQALSGTTSGANRAIWAVGLRNPFTFAIQPGTGKIYINNVGSNPPPDTPNSAGPFESVYTGAIGANYGWPNAEGNQSCSTYTCPLYTYDHSLGCAIVGGDFYNPTTVTYPQNFVGNYFFADYCGNWVKRIDQNNANAVTNFVTGVLRPVDLKVSSGGDLYILNRVDDNTGSGRVTKIVYATPTHTVPAAGSTNIWCEGESANPLTSPMVRGTDTSISQDYVYTTVIDVTSTTPPTTTGVAEYNFDVPTSALYTFTARMSYPDASSNSFWIQFDNNTAINKFGNDNNFNNWHWVNYSDGDTTAVTIRVNLTQGAHKLRVFGREPNTKLERWVLSTDSLFAPLDSDRGSAANCALSANQMPTPTITTPAVGSTYTHGQTINFAATATDPEDGTLPASAFAWNIEFGHSTHFHPHQSFTGIKSGSFVANFMESADNVFYRITLTVTDSGGKQASVFRDVLPVKSTVSVASVPSGLQIKLDGVANTTPFSFIGVVNFPRELDATSPQSLSGKNYQFASWSDSQTQKHTINTPSTNTTYTATFQQVTTAGDINGDGKVGGADLAILISTWGSTTDLRADFNSNKRIDSADLAVLISKWSP
ncbi:MAG TPA: PQQ-dependent sugar dehydrogenase [Candidatus Saccharimonadales bacterium]|nr:PQQ-dependent sugar dehydrogenase [Candidatus Saccharimonadales bacterium]